MKINLSGRSCLSLLDFSAAEINYLVELSQILKSNRKHGITGKSLIGKNVALVFEKPSTRTRCSFEISIMEEGGQVSYIDGSTSPFGKKESVIDSAKVLAGYYHAIAYRGFSQENVVNLAKYSGLPVYNGLTDDDHPTQILADLLTIREYLPNKPFSKLKVVFVGDTRNNLTNAWMYASARMGIDLVMYGPKELHPNQAILDIVTPIAKQSGSVITVSDQVSCLNGADVIYTDAWISMGEEDKLLERYKLLKNFQVTKSMLEQTHNPQVLFMHCLPAFHNMDSKFVKDAYDKHGIDICEVTEEVFNGPNSVVFEESANRLHTIKAVIIATIGGK